MSCYTHLSADMYSIFNKLFYKRFISHYIIYMFHWCSILNEDLIQVLCVYLTHTTAYKEWDLYNKNTVQCNEVRR